MPLIKAKQKDEKEQVRITIPKSLLEEINEYCKWANFSKPEKPDEFLEQAASYVLKKDKEWAKYQEELETA